VGAVIPFHALPVDAFDLLVSASLAPRIASTVHVKPLKGKNCNGKKGNGKERNRKTRQRKIGQPENWATKSNRVGKGA